MSSLAAIVRSIVHRVRSRNRGYGYAYPITNDFTPAQDLTEPQKNIVTCPACGIPVTSHATRDLSLVHNVKTCRLVNLALAELGVGFDRIIQVSVYPHSGPLRGYYLPADPYTIHVSDGAYSQFPEYAIFHETKHLVDCLTKGWSEENSPDMFARMLCAKYGFSCPPAHPHL